MACIANTEGLTNDQLEMIRRGDLVSCDFCMYSLYKGAVDKSSGLIDLTFVVCERFKDDKQLPFCSFFELEPLLSESK
jgi:hypothetical protein